MYCQHSLSIYTVRNIVFFTIVHPQLIGFPSSVRSVVVGEDLVVSCEAEGRPTPSILWKKNNTVLNSSQSDISIMSSNGRSELTITNVTNFESGEYSCTAVNQVGNDTHFFEVNTIGKFNGIEWSSSDYST